MFLRKKLWDSVACWGNMQQAQGFVTLIGQVEGAVEMLLENNCKATEHRWSGAKQEGCRGCAAQGKITIIYTLPENNQQGN